MPVIYHPEIQKYSIGKGKPVYDTEELAKKAMRGMMFDKYGKKDKRQANKQGHL